MVNLTMHSTMATLQCRAASDQQFGPRIDPACRPFDFTLFFEDTIFILLPSVLFLTLLPAKLYTLWRATIKMESYTLLR